MNERYEYEVLTLQRGGRNGHDYCWHSDRDGQIGQHNDLCNALNCRGARGWHVVAYASDGRFGNTLLLQRQVQESVAAAPVPVAKTTRSRTQPIPVTPEIAALAQSVKTLVQQNEVTQRVLQQMAEQQRHEIAAGLNMVSETLRSLSERSVTVSVPADPLLATVLQAQTKTLQELVERSTPLMMDSSPEQTPSQPQAAWLRRAQEWVARAIQPALTVNRASQEQTLS
jgi:hypothetical protein